MVKKENIWKFNDDDWKIHFDDKELLDKVCDKFNLGTANTVYYEQGVLSEATSWDIIVPDDKIEEVKKFLKDKAWLKKML